MPGRRGLRAVVLAALILACPATPAFASGEPSPLDSPFDGSSPSPDTTTVSDPVVRASVSPNPGRPGDRVKISLTTANIDNGYWAIDDCGAQLLDDSSATCVRSATGGAAIFLTVPRDAIPDTTPITWYATYHLVWTDGQTHDGSGAFGRGDGDLILTVLPPRTTAADSPTPRDPSPADQGAKVTNPPPSTAQRPAGEPLRRVVPLVIALLAGGAATALALWLRRRPGRPPTARRVRVVPRPDLDGRVRIRETPNGRTRVVRLESRDAVTAVEIRETPK